MGLGSRFGILMLAAITVPAVAGDDRLRSKSIRGLESQEAEISWELPHEKTGRPWEAARRKCHVFAGHYPAARRGRALEANPRAARNPRDRPAA
jgi:hypothetical protein